MVGLPRMKRFPGLPGRRCDEEEEAGCEEPSFVERLAVAFVAGAAPVLAQALLLKLFPSLGEAPPEPDDEPEPDE